MVEDDDDPGFVIENDEEPGFVIEDDDEEEVEEDDGELQPGQIIGVRSEDENPGVARRAAARRGDSDRYSRAREFSDRDGDDDDYERRRSDDRRLAYNDDGAPADDRDRDYSRDDDPDHSRDDDRDDDRDSDSDRASDRDYDFDRDDRDRDDRDRTHPDYDRDREGYSSRGSSRATSRTPRRGGPWVSVRAAAGWTLYYPQDLHLGMFDYGFEVSVFAMKWLTIDVAADFWVVSLMEEVPDAEPIRTVRTLPGFYLGATWRGTFHRIVRPYAGLDLGALLYAQATRAGDQSGLKVPLFAPTVLIDVGSDFVLHRNVGLFVGVRGGVSHAARIRETVNAGWAPTTGVFMVRAGALVQF